MGDRRLEVMDRGIGDLGIGYRDRYIENRGIGGLGDPGLVEGLRD